MAISCADVRGRLGFVPTSSASLDRGAPHDMPQVGVSQSIRFLENQRQTDV